MKRLLCVLSSMNAGGAETFLMKLYRSIDRTEYQFDFAVNVKEEGFYDKEINSLGGKIYRFPSKSESLLGYVKGLKKIIKENHYNYVLRITSNGMGFLDLAIAKFAGAKVCIARSSNSSDGNGVKSLIAHFIGKLLLKRFVDVKIAPSKEAAVYTFGRNDVLSGLVSILPNGLDLDYYKYDEKKREEIRKEFSISSDCFVVGHVGRFNEQKNHVFLLNVFAEFHKKNPNSKLLLVGDGSLKGKIISQIEYLKLQDCVIMTGIRSDLPSLYSAMDVFVFPSLYEGMPNAVLEAQACGLKSLVSEKITRESNVTGSVSFLPIDENSVNLWVDNILTRTGRNDSALPQNYDVKNVVCKFEKLLWGKNAYVD